MPCLWHPNIRNPALSRLRHPTPHPLAATHGARGARHPVNLLVVDAATFAGMCPACPGVALAKALRGGKNLLQSPDMADTLETVLAAAPAEPSNQQLSAAADRARPSLLLG